MSLLGGDLFPTGTAISWRDKWWLQNTLLSGHFAELKCGSSSHFNFPKTQTPKLSPTKHCHIQPPYIHTNTNWITHRRSTYSDLKCDGPSIWGGCPFERWIELLKVRPNSLDRCDMRHDSDFLHVLCVSPLIFLDKTFLDFLLYK